MPSTLAARIAGFAASDGFHATPVPGVHCVHYARTDSRTRRQWRAGLAIVAQGTKEILLGRTVYRCRDGHYTVAPIPLPVVSRIAEAAPERPFLGLVVDWDALAVHEIATQMASPNEASGRHGDGVSRALFTGVADGRMLDAATRLVGLFEDPVRARVVGPLVVRELFFDALSGEAGTAIRQFVRTGSAMQRIATAVFTIRTQLHASIDVDTLARASGMSRSLFFQRFRDVTAMSPVQYQKRIRLLEARRLMVDLDETAERAAFSVGYRSPSQFSRDYARTFGLPPRRDKERLSRGRGLRQI